MLAVRSGTEVLATIDRSTHRATTARPQPARTPERSGGGPAAWAVVVAIAAAMLIAGGFALAARRRPASVPEVPPVREDHRDAGGVGGLDDLVVTNRAARLDDGGDARVDRELGPV